MNKSPTETHAASMVQRVGRAIENVLDDYDFYLPPDQYERLAREAIEAMREPTDAMVAEAVSEYVGDIDATVTWQAMIDAALTPPGEG